MKQKAVKMKMKYNVQREVKLIEWAWVEHNLPNPGLKAAGFEI